MRKKLMFLVCICIVGQIPLLAQTGKGNINGKVIDGDTKTVTAATITLLKAKDSSVVKLSVANQAGEYTFEQVDFGKYLVAISAAGHEKGYSDILSLNAAHPNVVVQTIKLEPLVKSLTSVVVSTQRPLIEQKIDRMVVNVSADVTNAGNSALEVLEKSPGVSVDKDGNISLKGKKGVQIYIDGRPSYLSGADLASYLQNLRSEQLSKIEIMTNPPAKYDAAGNSGIINIKTKKTKQVGYMASLSSTYVQGKYARFYESLNLNYRNKKVNLFANIGYNNENSYHTLYIQRKFLEPTTKNVRSLFDQQTRLRSAEQSLSAKLGLDYSISKNTTLGFVVTGFRNPETFGSFSDVFIADPNEVLQSRTIAQSDNDKTWKNYTTNLNFRHVFDSAGTEITADFDYLKYNSRYDQSLINTYYDAQGNPNMIPDTLLGMLPRDITIKTGRIDFTRPLKNGAKFEAGLKTSFVKTDNNAIYDSLIGGMKTRDFGRSNHFIYDENINAAYVNYSRPLGKKFFAQLGLRLEHTNAKGFSEGYSYRSSDDSFYPSDTSFNRNYVQLFPTVFFQFKPNDKNTFGINYGKRINRPDYEDMNPFLLFLDRYTFEQGNPNLRPQFSHNIELSHTYKGFLTTTLNYTQTTDIINEVLEQNIDKNETFIKKYNIAKQRQVGIAVSAGHKITKWWNGNVYANVYYDQFEGIINNDYVKKTSVTGQFNISNQFDFGKNWNAELGGFYRTRALEGVFNISGFAMMNMGVSKQILKGKALLKFNVRDVLYSQKIKGHIQYSDIDVRFHQERDTRRFSIGFTYRLNKGKTSKQKRRTTGAEDEQSRVGVGN
ncbi:MAG: TonB-dependent receptor [Chitinophagaceae bacterium]|nr:TonB-dependent receptor [Chitinophagaceae bacterium]